jgi:hypothetical protein
MGVADASFGEVVAESEGGVNPRIVYIEYRDLESADLIVDAIYRGGHAGHYGDDPLDKLLHCGNMGGFRILGTAKGPAYKLVALYTTFSDSDWPDQLDPLTGRFIYYGDNKDPGGELHGTPKGGNQLLRHCFEAVHVAPHRRRLVPPFFVFSKTGRGRDVHFHGLAVPGAPGLTETEDLVAIWKTRGSVRFQNYRATFTILNAPRIERPWINSLGKGQAFTASTPGAWKTWIEHGTYEPLTGSTG